MSKVKTCRISRPCGSSCISLNKTCLLDSSASADKLSNHLTSTINSAQPTFNNGQVLAQGNFGKVTLSDDGQVVKKELLTEREGNEWGTMEVELGIRMGEAGYSPKVYSHLTNEAQIVMDVVPGKPIWEGFRQNEEDGEQASMSEVAGKKALDSILYLHKELGAYHGDAHAQQFIISDDDVKVIDFGLSGAIDGGDSYKKAATDIRKIRKFVGLDRFQEEPGVVGEIAKLFTQDAEIKGASKTAKALKQETVDKYKEILKR